MAEIRIEPKRRSLAWLWILLALAVIAAVAWYLVNRGAVQVETTAAPRPAAVVAAGVAAAAPLSRALG